MTFLRIVITLYLFDLSTIFSENRCHFSGSCSTTTSFHRSAPLTPAKARSVAAEPYRDICVVVRDGGITMQTFVGMILGALLLVGGVYVYDSMQTSSVASGQVAQANRTIVNWDVAAADWAKLKTRAHDDWVKISSK
jgi:hypothetical protein